MSATEKTESTASKLPSHIAYQVRDREGQKSWILAGVAYFHEELYGNWGRFAGWCDGGVAGDGTIAERIGKHFEAFVACCQRPERS
jgi:hypothetical protein